MKYERLTLTTFPNTEKRVENKAHGRVFLTNYEVFGTVVKHSLSCFINVLRRKWIILQVKIIKIRYLKTVTSTSFFA